MLNWMKKLAERDPANILAIETAVVDLQYPKSGGDDVLKRQFFAHLKEYVSKGGGTPAFTDNPRGGDMCMVMAEDLDAALIAFARDHRLIDAGFAMAAAATGMSERDIAAAVRGRLFGTPVKSAGGSLANTAHALLNAKIDGVNLVKGEFATAIGADESGQVFADAMQGQLIYNQGGRTMECHVFPIDGDRIMITCPSKADPAEAYIDESLLSKASLRSHTRVMLGGFLLFTPGFDKIFDTVIKNLAALPQGQRPEVVITAAAQSVANTAAFRNKVGEIAALTNVVIHANTGEFRRLMFMDVTWRKPFEADFTGLRGQALDAAKDAHAPYQAAKRAANQNAMDVAQERAKEHYGRSGLKTRYVVTDGGRGIYVVDPYGIETISPHKISRAQIVSTVGAGDNFAAGFQLADIHGLPARICMMMGRDFARTIIQSPHARIPAAETAQRARHTFGGALSAIDESTIEALREKARAPGNTPKP